MPTRTRSNPFPRLTRLGGPKAGTVAALAVGQAGDETTVFAGTPVGLFRSVGFAGDSVEGWERLAAAPIGIVCLAASPSYNEDQTLIAGTNNGIFVSRDGGDTWQGSPLPIAGAVAVALAFSTNYPRDGVLLAGTLEDGVFYSDNRGASWQRKSFGLLDATAYAVAFSPSFGHDETVLAGTDSTVYYSYNGARAWKATGFPESAAPVLSVAFSPDFAADQTLWAGTESQGLYRSTDRGQAWSQLGLPAVCVNALSSLAGGLLAATEKGLYGSTDRGDTWQLLLEQPNVISLAGGAGLTLAGLVDQGAWMGGAAGAWQPVPDFSARALVGLAHSPQFERDRTAYLFGQGEAPWRSTDGGATWVCLDDDELSGDLRDLALAPDFARSRAVAAASLAGVLLSPEAGEHWQVVLPHAAGRVAFAPEGRLLAAALEPSGLAASDDAGQSWRPVPGPWSGAGRVIALAVDNAQQYHLAWLEGVGETLSLWQGKPGQFEKVLSVPAGKNPLAALYLPAEPAPDRPWYAGVGNQVWKFSARRGRPPVASTVFEADERGDSLLSLTGAQTSAGQVLLASSGRQIFKSTDGQDWTVAYDCGVDRALALALSPTYAKDKLVYLLLLGGAFAQAVIR